MNPDEAYSKSFDPELARRILVFARPYRRTVILALVAILVGTVVANLFPLLLALAVDRALAPTEPTPTEQRYQTLFWIAGALLALRIVDFGARFAQTYLLEWTGQHVLFDLRSAIFKKVQRLHLGFFDRTPVGRLLTRITSDVDALNQFITAGLVGVLADIFMIVGIAGFMLFLNWRLALVAFAIFPILMGITLWIRRHMRDSYRNMRLALSVVNASLNENLTGVSTTQIFRREPKNLERFDQLNRKLLAAWLEVVRWYALFFPLVGFVGEVGVAAALWYGGGEVVRGAVSLGVLVAFLDYTRNFFQPVQDLSERFNLFQAAMASAERIFLLLDTEEKVQDSPTAISVAKLQGQIEFDQVWFSYADEPTDADWVLRNVSFKVEPGERVALVGATGAGKSSTVSLISRFYDVQKGAVKIDGIDVRSYTQASLHRGVGTVFQDPFLFSGTVLDNLRLWNPEIPGERVMEVARYVGSDRVIERLPKGLDSLLGERGAGLSTGEKQLLALTRALVANPDVLLILDEATASVDSATEAQMQEALERSMAGRTSVVIAHRLSTIKMADRILVFKQGRIIEQGSHSELLEEGGYYARLYSLQYSDISAQPD